MTEATLEQPEVKETPAATAAPSNPNHPGSVTLNLFGNKPEKKAEAAPEKVEQAVEKKEPEPVKEKADQAPVKKNDSETNLANMRKKLEEYEAQVKAASEERDRLKAEYEQFKTKPPELPEEVKTKLTAAERYEKELQEARAILRQTNLEKDPDFQAKYDQPIQNRIKTMGQVALAAGITEAEWRSAVRDWNTEKFGEWLDTMSAGQRLEFQSAWQKAQELYLEKTEQLQNAEKVWGDLEKQRKEAFEAQQKEILTGNERLAREIIKETLSRGDAAQFEGLNEAMEGVVLKAARYELSPKEVFEQIAANQVLARSVQKQHEALKERESKIAELEKKISEQDEFIKAHAGAVPRQGEAGKTGSSDEKYVPPWQRLVVK